MSDIRNCLLTAGVLAVILAGPLFLVFWSHGRPVRPAAIALDDLTGDAAPLLSSFPHVVEVKRAGSFHPPIRIIQLLDTHAGPFELHKLGAGNRGQPHGERHADVEHVQLEEELFLYTLATQYGVREVLIEGLTPAGTKAWRARLDLLATMRKHDADLRRALADAQKLGNKNLIGETVQLLERARRERLELGAVAVLASQGVLKALPLDDDATPDTSELRGQGPTSARDKAIVGRALAAASPVAVIVLGGGHDLTREIARQSNGRAEYLRVTLRAHGQANVDRR